MDDGGVLRRSLRRINPFKNNLFRLPATPRLTRSKKVGNGEDVVTEWNFERASNGRCSTKSVQVRVESPPSPDTVSLPVMNKSVPQPPRAQEAEKSIHDHMKQLLVSPALQRRNVNNDKQQQQQQQKRYLQLPNTKYRADGQVVEAHWSRDYELSPNNSTLSLLNTGRRSVVYDPSTTQRATTTTAVPSSPTATRTPSLRTSYPLNGISRPPSADLFKRNRMISNNTSTELLKPLFTINALQNTDDTFIAREWVFREIYQSAIVEKIDITVIEGANGSGKSSIYNQLVFNSSFHSGQTSDTMDSGCVSDSFSLPSRNYEWMRAVSARIVAYHSCSIQDASSCSIPEFVCNLGALLSASPVLKSYAAILQKKPELLNLLRLKECLKHDSLDVFKKTIAEPLGQLKSTDQGSLVILLDGLDEAEYHRCEDGRSICMFIQQIVDLLPAWLRIVVTCDGQTTSILNTDKMRLIRIDDCSVDERVVRDNRMYVEYRIGMVRELEDSIIALRRSKISDPLMRFSEQLVEKASGNMLYIRLLLQLLETGKLRMTSLSSIVLPDDLHGIYDLYMDLTFPFANTFQRVSPVLSILLASLRPLTRRTLLDIMNSGNEETRSCPEEIDQILTVIAPLLSFGVEDSISIHHVAFRDWLIRNETNAKYPTDVRKGHLLIALWLSGQAPLDSSQLFELGHHLLKAHPYKYMHGEYIPELTSSKDGLILWIQRSTEHMAAALMDDRNMHFPNTKVSRLLLVAGADPSYAPEGPDATTVSQKAVAAGHWALISLLLHYGADLHPRTGVSLLSMAARHGHLEIVRQLRTMDDQCGEAVKEAAANDHLQIVTHLLSSHWSSEDSKLDAVEDALIAAAAKGHTSICQYLVDSYESVDISHAMRSACENGKATVVQFFLSRGATLTSLSWPSDKPALHCAVESGSWDLVVAVLSLPDSHLETIDGQGKTPLLAAARCGHVGLVDMLINKGANIDHRDKMGWTALMHAIRHSHQSTVQLLLDKEADTSGTDLNGNSIAHISCAFASRSIVDRLLEHGMLFEEKDKNGDRPIETAIRHKNCPALEALLRRGARLRTSTWETARHADPEAIFILLAKLMDDAAILFRKKRLDEAMHRLHYALAKIEICLNDNKLTAFHKRFTVSKAQVLLSTARVHRKEGNLDAALNTCHEAAALSDNNDMLFEVLLLRAKCNFDRHDVDRARADARAASQLRPSCDEARHLLNTLLLPSTDICRL